jgi:pseudaminic acid cytidylyltransferase
VVFQQKRVFKMTKESICIFLARGGSKRIPHKNIIDFYGKPIIEYPYITAQESKLFSEIHISTDDSIILKTLKTFNYVPPFSRPSELAQDNVPALTVVRWILQQYKNRGQEFHSVCLVFPCSPLITSEDLISAYRFFTNEGGLYPVMSVSNYPVPVSWALKKTSTGRVIPFFPESMSIQSQNLETAFYDTGNFVFFNSNQLLETDYVSFPEFLPFLLPRERAVDIDTLEDLHWAKKLYLLREK